MCTLSGTTFKCTCAPTFTGPICSEQDPCGLNPCKNNGQCISSGSSYQCRCQFGFQGKNCEIADVCNIKNPCLCGTCINDADHPLGFRCMILNSRINVL